jgi:hypothetical protein
VFLNRDEVNEMHYFSIKIDREQALMRDRSKRRCKLCRRGRLSAQVGDARFTVVKCNDLCPKRGFFGLIHLPSWRNLWGLCFATETEVQEDLFAVASETSMDAWRSWRPPNFDAAG